MLTNLQVSLDISQQLQASLKKKFSTAHVDYSTYFDNWRPASIIGASARLSSIAGKPTYFRITKA